MNKPGFFFFILNIYGVKYSPRECRYAAAKREIPKYIVLRKLRYYTKDTTGVSLRLVLQINPNKLTPFCLPNCLHIESYTIVCAWLLKPERSGRN